MPVTESSVDFDWFSPEVCRDPQFYDGLIREAAPVVYSPQYDVWATGRHAPIAEKFGNCVHLLLHRTASDGIGIG